MYRSSRPSSLTTFCALAVLSLPTTSALAQGVDQSSPLIEKVRHATARGVWALHNPPPAVPALEGNLLNYFGEPNRFGLPAFYELHVWAWEHNPMGRFADWNTHVTCDHQPVSAAGTAAR
jgi:hypothetical protein